MRIPRFVTSLSSPPQDYNKHPGGAPGVAISIAGADLHHLRNVLRLTKGDLIEVSDVHDGSSFLCRLTSVTNRKALAEILQELSTPSMNQSISLIMGLGAPKTSDFITEKCVELGVDRIHFFRAQRSQGKNSDCSASNRLQRIAKAAIKQSGASRLPLIEFHQSLQQALFFLHNGEEKTTEGKKQSSALCLVFVPSERKGEDPSWPLMIEFFKQNQILPLSERLSPQEQLQEIVQNAESFLLLGPEGGLVPEEIELAKEFGYLPVSLGPRILRAQTAALVACALVGMFRAT